MKTMKNKVQLIGILGNDPEIKLFDDEKTMARFSLSTIEIYKDTEGKKASKMQWHNIVAWGSTATLVQRLLKKGQEIAIEGKLSHRMYEDGKGIRRYISEIVVNDILLLQPANKAA